MLPEEVVCRGHNLYEFVGANALELSDATETLYEYSKYMEKKVGRERYRAN